MAVAITLDSIASGYNLSKINSNFSEIKGAFEKVLGREGDAPNSMEADLDMNGNDIINIDIVDAQRLRIQGEEFVPGDVTAVGPKGEDGEDATLELGTVTTGSAGTDVIITNTGSEHNAVFNFTIPRGDKGESGAGTGDMLASQNLNDVSNKATAFDNIKQAATDSATGVVELATDAEVITGTDTTRAVTPAGGTAAFERKGRLVGYNARTSGYTLVLGDAGQIVSMNTTATITIPPQASVAWADCTRVDFVNIGSGDVTISPGSGVTLNSKDGKRVLNGQYAGATIIRIASNSWVLIGDLK